MTDLEICIAIERVLVCIAIERVLGFKVELSCAQSGLDAVRNGERRPMMVYTENMNAMLDVRSVLKVDQLDKYYSYLYRGKHPADVTPRDCAEAFLRTLGEWKEAK